MNVLLDETKGPVWSPDIRHFCTQLRVQPGLDFLRYEAKPDNVGLGDFILKSALDQFLIGLIIGGRYQEVSKTLVRLFGETLTSVSAPDNRQNGRKK